MFIPVMNNAWSEAEYDRALHLSGPTLALRAKRIQSITQADNAISAWASRIGTISFAQATAANKPKLTRGDNAENRALSSEDVSNATYWTPARASALSVTEIKEDATASSTHYIVRATAGKINVVAGQTYYLAVSLKRGVGSRDVRIMFYWPTAGITTAYINLATGAITGTGGTTTAWVTGPTSVADGTYWRVYGTITSPTTGIADSLLIGMTDAGTATYNGDNTSTIHVNKFEFRSFLADPTYIPTTTAPQYRGVNGRPAVLLDGVDDVMTSAATLADIYAAGAKTVMHGIRPSVLNIATNQYLLTNATANRNFTYLQSTTYYASYSNIDVSGQDYADSANLEANKAVILVGRHSTAIDIAANNKKGTAVASGDTLNTGYTLRIGSRFDATGWYAGPLTDLLTWNKVLHSQTIDKLTRLAAKERGASLQ